jgi:hypothetical protein
MQLWEVFPLVNALEMDERNWLAVSTVKSVVLVKHHFLTNSKTFMSLSYEMLRF